MIVRATRRAHELQSQSEARLLRQRISPDSFDFGSAPCVNEAGSRAFDERAAKEKEDQIFRASGVPAAMRNARLDLTDGLCAEHQAAIMRVRRLLNPSDGMGRIALFHGVVGSGKTYCAAALVLAMIGLKRRARFDDAREFIVAARAGYCGEARESWAAMFDRYRRPALLALDEVTSVLDGPTTFARERIEEIVNRRYLDGTDTILISNCEIVRARELLGERIYDRMRDRGGEIAFAWPSLRGRGQAR